MLQTVLSYLIPLVVGVVGLLLWLFLGDVLKDKVEGMRTALRTWCQTVAASCRDGATACFNAARACAMAIPRALRAIAAATLVAVHTVHAQLRGVVSQNGTTTTATDSGASSVPPTSTDRPASNMVFFMALLFLGACAGNFLLMQEITPDLINFSPEQMRHGIGRVFLWLLPAFIVIAEAAGGMMLKYERRQTGSWTRYLGGIVIFGFFYLLELAGGARRAYANIEESNILDTEIGDYATAAQWVVLAMAVPMVIFVTAMYVEKSFSESRAIGSFLQGVVRGIGSLLSGLWRAGGPVIVILVEAIAFLVLGAAMIIAILVTVVGLAVAIVATTLGGVLCSIGRVVFGQVVRVVLLTALALGIGFPADIAVWRRNRRAERLRGTMRTVAGQVEVGRRLALLLCIGSGLASANCGGGASLDIADKVTEFAVVHAADVQTEAPSETIYDSVPNSKLVKAIVEQHPIVRVDEPKFHVCLADISASVRSGGLRREILTRCAQLVSEVSAEQGPETTGVVLPIVEAGVASDTAIEVFERKSTATRCVINPPLPTFERNTVIIGKMSKLRKRYDKLLGQCSSEVASAYTAAKEARAQAQPDFVRRVQERFGNASRLRTDILGTLAYVREYLDREEQRLGAKFATTISVVSDLEDDANGCVYRREGIVMCSDDVMTAAVRVLCRRDGVQCYAHQVRQGTLASRRGSGFATANRAQAEREEAWKQFARDALGFQNVYTFTAPTGVTDAPTPISPPPLEGEQEGVAPPQEAGHSRPAQDDPPPKPKKKGTCSSLGTLKSLQPRLAAGTLGDEIFTYGYALGSCGPEKRPWESVDMDRDAFKAKYIAPFLSRGTAFRDADPNAYRRVQGAW